MPLSTPDRVSCAVARSMACSHSRALACTHSRALAHERQSSSDELATSQGKETMTINRNRQILLASRPRGEPTLDNFKLVEADVSEPGSDQMLLHTVYLSLDPYMRGRMNAGVSYARPVEIGEVMEGRSVCEVVKSNIPHYKAGDIVLAGTGWQEFS